MGLLRNEFEIVYINSTGSRLSEDALISAIHQAEYVIAGTERFTKNVIESSPRLKVLSRVGVGIDNIDLKAAENRSLCILNTPQAPALSVAEHTLALILTILKHIPDYNSQIRRRDFSIQPGTLLMGKTIGIVGMGRIGSTVASMLQALGCKITYFDPYLPEPSSSTWTAFTSLKDLAAGADIITIHAVPQQNGSALFDEHIFKHCKRGCIIINTSRGSLIDEIALEHALNEGIVYAAGLDVFSNEPYSGTLLIYPQVIVTPHVASNTIESRQDMEMEAVEHIIEIKKGLVK
jgi:D-3-phosphoglycerate dehydrogenase